MDIGLWDLGLAGVSFRFMPGPAAAFHELRISKLRFAHTIVPCSAMHTSTRCDNNTV